MQTKKTFYFVRHGESESNVTDIHNDPAGPLTKSGREQASFLAERFKSIPLDIILASHYERAQETAHIIAERIGVEVQTEKLLGEKRMASSKVGKAADHPDRLRLPTQDPRQFEENARYEDEEMFDELKERALKLLEHLKARSEERLLLVTHGWFLRIVIAAMLYGKSLTGAEAHQFWKFFTTKNTGITMCEYDESNINEGWRLVTWMDHAHLGDGPTREGTT